MTFAPADESPEFLGVSGIQRKAARGTARSVLAINILLLAIDACATAAFCYVAVQDDASVTAVGILAAGCSSGC